MILGFIFQKGFLPFDLIDLENSFVQSIPKSELAFNQEAFYIGRMIALGENFDTNENLDEEQVKRSVAMAAYPWQNSTRFIQSFEKWLVVFSQKIKYFKQEYWAQILHDLIVFNQGTSIAEFYEDVILIDQSTWSEVDKVIAIRTLAKTYWIKDEVFVAHLMIAPQKLGLDEKRYKNLGSSYKVVHINRPSFDLFGTKIEFDFSPKAWMLKLMRHARLLRLLMPHWHKVERRISQDIRDEIRNLVSTNSNPSKRLKELESVKGYREVRYKSASKYLGNSYV
jgi:indolepyruvate ferredoxin oxidoreductase